MGFAIGAALIVTLAVFHIATLLALDTGKGERDGAVMVFRRLVSLWGADPLPLLR